MKKEFIDVDKENDNVVWGDVETDKKDVKIEKDSEGKKSKGLASDVVKVVGAGVLGGVAAYGATGMMYKLGGDDDISRQSVLEESDTANVASELAETESGNPVEVAEAVEVVTESASSPEAANIEELPAVSANIPHSAGTSEDAAVIGNNVYLADAADVTEPTGMNPDLVMIDIDEDGDAYSAQADADFAAPHESSAPQIEDHSPVVDPPAVETGHTDSYEHDSIMI